MLPVDGPTAMIEPLRALDLMSVCLAMVVALAIDQGLGEPPVHWHPVVAMGRYLGWFTTRLSQLAPVAAWVGGTLAWWMGALLVGALAALAQASLMDLAMAAMATAPGAPWAALLATAAAASLMGVLLKPLLAWRMLRDEVAAVDAALQVSLQAGRTQLSRLVSRDVSALSEAEVREAAIETLAENLNDSVVAPLFWFCLAGLPGAAVYRFANTADAMWGYKDHRRWMGQWAARTDDVLSWLPARLTAVVMLCWPLAPRAVWRALPASARRTPSPNGGWPMGAMALLLGVRLAKPGVYVLNEGGRAPQSNDVQAALLICGGLVLRVGLASMGLAAALVLWLACWPAWSTSLMFSGPQGVPACTPWVSALCKGAA